MHAARPLESLARSFRRFAAQECAAEPLYDALCRAAAEDSVTLQLLWHAPPMQQRPNLLLAAVHDLVLRGTPDPLRAYFPSAGGDRPVDEELARRFVGFRDAHRAELIDRIAHRTTQTNEIGRCAVLWPALQYVARRQGCGAIALLDFGCSAGLNLGVDAYHYAYGVRALGAAASPEAPLVECRLIGARGLPPLASRPARIALRQGIDVSPIDVSDEEAVRWLRACLWPHDVERARRFDRAVALARKRAWPVARHADSIGALEAWVRSLPKDVLPVVWNCWVLTYLDAEAGAHYVRTLEALVQDAGVAWLSAEAPTLGLYPCVAPPPCVEGEEHVAGTLWTLCSAGVERPRYEVLARAHPHGKWLEWLAQA